MNQEHRILWARMAVVATLVLAGAASWTVSDMMSRTPGVTVSVGR